MFYRTIVIISIYSYFRFLSFLFFSSERMLYSECSTNVRLIFFIATGDTGGAFLFRLLLVAGGSVMEGEGSAAK